MDINWKYGFRPFTQGRHGLTGVILMGDQLVAVKASNHATLTGLHEHIVLSCLAPLQLPFFPRPLGCHTVLMDLCALSAAHTLATSAYNTAFVSSKTSLQSIIPKASVKAPIDICCMTYFSKARKITECIASLRPHMLASIARQTLHVMSTAYAATELTHYDLHANNVMVDRCDPNIVLLFEGPAQCLVPTHGVMTCIIDFGFAWCRRLHGEPITGAVEFQDKGFLPQPDPFADMRVFLSSLTTEVFERMRQNELSTHVDLVEKLDELCDEFCRSDSVSRKNGWLQLCTDYLPVKIAMAVMLENVSRQYRLCASGTHLHVAQLLTALCVYPLDSVTQSTRSTQVLLKHLEHALRAFVGIIVSMMRENEPPQSVLVLVRACVLQYLKCKSQPSDHFAHGMVEKLRSRSTKAGGVQRMGKLFNVMKRISSLLQLVLSRELHMRRNAQTALYKSCGLPIPGTEDASRVHTELLRRVDQKLHTPFVYTVNTKVVRIPYASVDTPCAACINKDLADKLNSASTSEDAVAQMVLDTWNTLTPCNVPGFGSPPPSLNPEKSRQAEHVKTRTGYDRFDYPFIDQHGECAVQV